LLFVCGNLRDVELNKIGDFEAALLSYANNEHADLMAEVNAKADYNDDIVARLSALIDSFKATHTW
jgi:F-type H+-transporting ATPase subunit alpha